MAQGLTKSVLETKYSHTEDKFLSLTLDPDACCEPQPARTTDHGRRVSTRPGDGGGDSRQIPDPPCAAAVRTLLRILEEKGHLRHEKDGPRHVYFPTTPRSVAQRSAVRHLLGTFFNGSRAAAVAALLDESDRPLSAEEREQITSAVKRLRAEGK